MALKPEQSGKDRPAEAREVSFWDTFPAMAFLVLSILFARWYVLEPFKIPSGSMEPTLFGHEDYGDRIVTNKLAYATPLQVWTVLGVSALALAIGFGASKGWRRARSIVVTALLAIGIIGGIFFAWARDAVAGQPTRFDVVVFQYNTEWAGGREGVKEQNYIKRLIGLPGEEIVVSAGDLYLHKNGRDEILRKWKERPEMQETVWYPISRAWGPIVHERPKEDDPNRAAILKQVETLRFPWTGAEPCTPGAELRKDSLYLDGSAPVTITYAFDATNVYLKQGRWAFRHVGCPAANKPGIQTESGVTFRNPDSTSESFTAYVTNTWQGVQCPNCKEIMFPMGSNRPAAGPWLTKQEGTKFFYGGNHVVGDLKLDLALNVETAGSLELEVGSTAHRALWRIPVAGAADTAPQGVHVVQPSGAPPELTPGRHTLSLAYVDATVIAVFDGRQVACQLIDVPPPGRAADKIRTKVRVAFAGLKCAVTKLDLSRDLYYTTMPEGSAPSSRDSSQRRIDTETGNCVQKLRDGEYMMMGDNSPSSADSRVWGHVPKDKLVGRASFVWWPPSRWRVIK